MSHSPTTDTYSVIVFKPDRQLMWGSLLCEWSILFPITDIKIIHSSDGRWIEHYALHVGKDFYLNLVDFMTEGYSLRFRAWGDVDKIRAFALLTRKRGYCEGPDNIIHASENWIEAQREWKVWSEN